MRRLIIAGFLFALFIAPAAAQVGTPVTPPPAQPAGPVGVPPAQPGTPFGVPPPPTHDAGGRPVPAADSLLPARPDLDEPGLLGLPLTFGVGTSLTWDDNVFRLPDNVDPATRGLPSRSDRFSATFARVQFDRTQVQQRYVLDATVTAYRYDRFSHLNFNALQFRGAWHWRTSPRLSGTLSGERSQALVNYSDFVDVTQRNVQTTQNFGLNADYRLLGGWRATGGLLYLDQRNTATFLRERGYRAKGGELGARYIAGTESSLSLVQRYLDGDYVERGLEPALLLDDGFERHETEGAVNWILTGRSSVNARITYVDFRSNNFAQRDFSGISVGMGARWTPTARLIVSADAQRSLEPSSDVFNHRREDRLTAGVAWEFRPRTAFKGSVYTGETDHRQPVLPFAGPLREDRFHGLRLSATWQPLRPLAFGASLQRERRSSNVAGFRYQASAATLSATLLF